jgi:hypothetical protein
MGSQKLLFLALTAFAMMLQSCGFTSPRFTSKLAPTTIRLQQLGSSRVEPLLLPDDLTTYPLALGVITSTTTITATSCLLVGAADSVLDFEVTDGPHQGHLTLPVDSIHAFIIDDKARYRLGLHETGTQKVGNVFGGLGAFGTIISPLISIGLWTGLSPSYGERLLILGGSSAGLMGVGLGIHAIGTAKRQKTYRLVKR